MIYFDNAATTKMHKDVFEVMKPFYLDNFANSSSKYYSIAKKSSMAVKKSRLVISELLACEPDEIIFTSGASESNNMILKSFSYHNNKTILSSPIEHSSISKVLDFISQHSRVEYLRINQDGTIDLEDLESKLHTNEVSLCTVCFVNSETGIVQDLQKISEVTKKYNVVLHSDITQAIGKIGFDFKKYKDVDMISFSAHKFHGPKGIGAAVIRKNNNGIKRDVKPLIHGGDQEYSYRSGTLNTPAIIGMAKAMEIAYSNLKRNMNILKELDDFFLKSFDNLNKVSILNKDFHRIAGYISLRIKGINNQIFLKKVGQLFAASTGSACSNSEPSKILDSLGFDSEIIRETIRISFSHLNSKEEIVSFRKLFY